MSGIGHVGELAVINHFEKSLKLPVYIPLQDTGIDFIAGRDDAMFGIQVKTSMFHRNSYFWFDLRLKGFRAAQNLFYVLVCHTLAGHKFMDKRLNSLVLPSQQLEKWLKAGQIVPKEGNPSKVNLYVYPIADLKQWTYRNKGKTLDWTPYWNNWAVFARGNDRR